MLRRHTLASLLLGALLLVGAPACGGSTGGAEEAADYFYSCQLETINGTLNEIVEFQWILFERNGSGDVVWDAQVRTPFDIFDPGTTQVLAIGPDYADVSDPSTLEWEIRFTDSADTTYGPWTRSLSDCSSLPVTVTPADAN